MSELDIESAALSISVEDASSQAPSSQRSTALSNKITSVLSTSFVDVEIKNALESLDQRKFENTPEARRRLRIDAQKEVIDRNGDIIRDFGEVAEQLRRIGLSIEKLNSCVDDIRKHVSAAHNETGPVLEEASTLLSQKAEVETKQQLLAAFKKHFILSDEALEHLTSSKTGVDAEFFALMYRLKAIHQDCQVLLGTESQQLGLELMEQSSRQLESAYQKLFKFAQAEFKTLDLENPRMNAPIRQALRVLAERPQLFQRCLDFFAEARERNLLDAFYAALVGASTQTDDRTTKPMEYYAHDPLRFVGDMLAWTHSATVSERESLEVLFIAEGDEMAKGIQAGIDNEPWLRDGADVFDGRKYLEQLVNRDFAGVAKALLQRLEQVIKSDEDPVLSYKISNVIDFYCTTLSRLLGSEGALLDTLKTCRESAMDQYRANTRDVTNALASSNLAMPSEWEAPDFLLDALSALKQLLKNFDSSVTGASRRDMAFHELVTESLDPFLAVCDNLAAQADEPASSIFTINCAQAAKEALIPWDQASDAAGRLDDRMDERAARLIDYQHAFLLQTSGVHPLLVALAPLTDAAADLRALRRLPAFQAQALADAGQVLDDFLPSALMDAAENLARLRDPRLAEDVTAEAALRFCEDFEHVEGRLAAADELEQQELGPEDGVENGTERPAPLRAIYPRTSGEIRVLLS